MAALTPGDAFVPALSDCVSSVSVLAVANGSGVSTACPVLRLFADGPYSLVLFRLAGNAAASFWVTSFCWAAGSSVDLGPCLAPATVPFAAEGLAEGETGFREPDSVSCCAAEGFRAMATSLACCPLRFPLDLPGPTAGWDRRADLPGAPATQTTDADS